MPSRGRPRKTPLEPEPSGDTLAREDFLRRLIARVESQINIAEENNAFTAISVLTKQLRDARDDLDNLLERDSRSAADPYALMSDEDLERLQAEAVRELPEHMLDGIVYALAERMGRNNIIAMLGQAELRVIRGSAE